MVITRHGDAAALILCGVLLMGCTTSESMDIGTADTASGEGDTVEVSDAAPSSTDGGASASDVAQTLDVAEGDAPVSAQPALTHKMMKETDENMFSALAYECPQCTLEQFAAIDPPEGWSKGPVQQVLAEAELRSTPSFEGVPAAMDFVPEVPGDDYTLIAKTLDGEVVEMVEGGAIVRAQVMRDTVLRFPAGTRVHELTSPEGEVFVLFAFGVDPEDLVFIDVQDPEALGDFGGPTGWTYASRILDEDLALDTPDVATVLAIRTSVTSTWQRR